MPVSTIVPLAQPPLTSQQIADLMLTEDIARRAALRRLDVLAAARHDMEVRKLAARLS